MKQYEPYFDTGFDYQTANAQGQFVTLFYDGLGRTTRTLAPLNTTRTLPPPPTTTTPPPLHPRPIAPWFGQPGMGRQYRSENSVEFLIQKGYLRQIKP